MILLLLLVALLVAPATAGAVERPIVYAVVIDGLDGDRVDQGKAPFISSLLAGRQARATYYRESRSIMPASTNPNHAAMMSGAYAEDSGVPANAFALYSPLENEDSCKATGPVDETKLPSETSGESLTCPQAEMVFEAIKRQSNPDGLVTAAVFGKPKLGRIFAGRNADSARRDVDHLWAPCVSGAEDDEYCGSVTLNPASGYALEDSMVMDEVIRTIREGVVVGGKAKRPDFTFVNLHQTDSAGHGFGVGAAYDEAIAFADREVERLVSELRVRGEWSRTVLILLSDHSMDTTVQKTGLRESLTDAGIDQSAYMIPSSEENGSVELIYLADRTSDKRFELLKRMRQTILRSPGVGEALYREPNPFDGGQANTLDGVHPGWHMAGPRTGDLVVTHRPGGAFADPSLSENPYPGHHGAPQTRDNFFAVIGGGDFVRQLDLTGRIGPDFEDTLLNPSQAENVDVASTVMGLFGLFATKSNAGRFMGEAFEVAKLPGGAKPLRPRLRARRLTRGRFRGTRQVPCYRLRWSPARGRYDLQARRRPRGSWRHVLRRTPRTSYTFYGLRGCRYDLRLRARAASGAHGDWHTRRLARVRRR